MFSNQIMAAMAQVLASISPSAASVLLSKHLGTDPSYGVDARLILQMIRYADLPAAAALLVEVVSNETSLRADASPKYVFDGRMRDLRAWMAHDGWEVSGSALVANAPAIKESTELRSRLLEQLGQSPVDATGEIRALIEASATSFAADPPDINGSTTHIRVALETLVRRAAKYVAEKTGTVQPMDRWGDALAFLKASAVITQEEEQGLAAAYRFISPGAHVPKTISDLEWARLVRTIALAMCYFLAFAVATT